MKFILSFMGVYFCVIVAMLMHRSNHDSGPKDILQVRKLRTMLQAFFLVLHGTAFSAARLAHKNCLLLQNLLACIVFSLVLLSFAIGCGVSIPKALRLRLSWNLPRF